MSFPYRPVVFFKRLPSPVFAEYRNVRQNPFHWLSGKDV